MQCWGGERLRGFDCVNLSSARHHPVLGCVVGTKACVSEGIPLLLSRRSSTALLTSAHPSPPSLTELLFDRHAAAHRAYTAMAVLFNFLGKQASAFRPHVFFPSCVDGMEAALSCGTLSSICRIPRTPP